MLDHNSLVRAASQLQPLPTSVGRLASLVGGDEPDFKAITEVISFDPVLTGKLLGVANSAFSGSLYPIGTVLEAVVRLGPGTVLGLAVGACAKPLLDQAIPAYDLPPGGLWRHSVAAALAADLARNHCEESYSPVAFTAALLHDLGKLILGRFLTAEHVAQLRRAVAEGGALPVEAEVEVLSLHHGEVGGVIAQHWKLPDEIVQGVIHHHTPERGETAICWVTHLANAVAKRVESGAEDEDGSLAVTRERLGMPPEGYDRLCAAVARRLGDVSERHGNRAPAPR